MSGKEIQTKLVKKTSKESHVCTFCDMEIPVGEVYHLEEGVHEHLHSLIARRFCNTCYMKYGERSLLRGSNQ